jgi:hypothetical protein
MKVVPKLKFWNNLPLISTIQYKRNSGMYAEYTIYWGAGGRNNALCVVSTPSRTPRICFRGTFLSLP